MTSNGPIAHVRVSQMVVRPQQVLTLWLGTQDDQTQVELRVLRDGTKEIFVSEGLTVRSFDDWKPEDSDHD